MKREILFKRVITGAILGLALVFANGTFAASNDLKTIGSSTAPIHLYLFSSFSCPHCTAFHETVLPQIKRQFIDTNKAYLTFVDMPFDNKAMVATLLARCIEPELYEPFTQTVFQNQNIWANSNQAKALLEGYTRVLGADIFALKMCANQRDLRVAITEQRNNLSALYKVTGMPTLVIVKNGNSEKISGTDEKVILSKIQSIAEGK